MGRSGFTKRSKRWRIWATDDRLHYRDVQGLILEVHPWQMSETLGDRIGNKPIKLKAPDDRGLELEASSQAEFDYAYEKAQTFLKGN